MDYSRGDMDFLDASLRALALWVGREPSVPVVFAEAGLEAPIGTPREPLIELLLVVAGTVEMTVGHAAVRLKEGDLLLMNAHFGNQGRFAPRGCRYDCVSLRVEGHREFAEFERRAVGEVRAVSFPAALHALYRDVSLQKHAPSGGLPDLAMKAALLRLLLAMQEEATLPLSLLPGSVRSPLHAALECLRRRQTDPGLSVGELARAAHVSPEHFSREFKRHFGLSPMSYLLRLRLGRARSLLERTALSVKEIALSTGFTDPLYFSRRYRKAFGHAPTGERRANV